MRLSHIDRRSMHWFSLVFIAALALATSARLWLLRRHIGYIAANRGAVPPDFAGRISLEAHQKAAGYNIAKARLGLIDTLDGVALVLILTFGGGLQWLSGAWGRVLEPGGFAHGIALIS